MDQVEWVGTLMEYRTQRPGEEWGDFLERVRLDTDANHLEFVLVNPAHHHLIQDEINRSEPELYSLYLAARHRYPMTEVAILDIWREKYLRNRPLVPDGAW